MNCSHSVNFVEKFLKKNYNEQYDLEVIRRRKYPFENRDKIIEYRCNIREKPKGYVKNRKQSELKFI